MATATRTLLLVATVLLGSAVVAIAAEPLGPVPCEWYPVDPADPDGDWYQPVPSDECEPPYRNEAPQMTLPPTDT